MKNEKMKRVAALALAGTMMASVVSPAAFADTQPDGGSSDDSKVNEPVKEEKTAPATVESAHEVDKGDIPVTAGGLEAEIAGEIGQKIEESGLNIEDVKEEDFEELIGTMEDANDAIQDNVDIIAVNPTIPTDAEDIQLPEDSNLSFGEDGLVMTPVGQNDDENPEEIPVDADGLLGRYDVDGMLGDMQDAVDQMGEDNPLKKPVKDALDQMQEELPDLVIGEDPTYVPPKMMDNDDLEEPAPDEGELGIRPGMVVDVDTTEKKDFDKEDQEAAEGIEDNLEGQLNKGNEIDDVSSVVVGDKTYNVIEVTEDKKDETDDGWNLVEDSLTQTVMTKDYTFVISSDEDTTTENAPLTAEEMAEILGVTLDSNSVVSEDDKLISFKDADGNTYTVEKNYGTDSENQTTNVFWKVNVTETKTTHKESAKVEGNTEVEDDSLEPDGNETVIVDEDENPGAQVVGDHSELGLSEAQIQDYLNGTVPEGYELVTGEDGVTKLVSTTNSNISYTIQTSVVEDSNITMTSEELLEMAAGEDGQEKIQELLGSSYTVQDGKIYYTVGDEKYEAHFKDGEIGQKLNVTIIKTDAKGAESDVKAEIDADQDGTAETVVGADDIAAQDALLQDQLKKEAEEKLKEALGDKFTSLEGVEWDVEGDKWTAKVTENGIEKTYTVTVAQKSESSLDKDLIDDVTPDQSQTVEVNGSAFVTKGEITWTGEYGPVYDCWGDDKEYNGLAGNFKDGKPVFDDEGGSVEEAESYEGKTFQGNTVSDVEVSEDGKTYTITTVGSDGLKKVYEFSYESVNADRVESALEHQYDGKDFTDVEAEADLTKLSWTVTTEKKQEQCVTDKTTVDGDIKEDNWWCEQDGDLYVKFEGEGICDPDDKVVIEEKPDGSWTAEGKDKNAEYTATAEEMTIEEVEAMLKEQGKTDVVVTQNTETGKFEVTYKKDGNTYSATYDAKDVTVEKKEDIQLSGKDDCYNTIYQALEQAYGKPGSGNGSYQIEEYETFLDGKEDSEANRQAFVESLAKSEDMTTTTTTEKLTGSKLESVVSSLDHGKAAVDKYTNEFNLQSQGTAGSGKDKINFVIVNQDVDWSAQDPTVQYGTASAVTGNGGRVNEFDIEDEITTESSKITNSKYEQDEPNWYGGKNYDDWKKNDSYYHVTGTAAYTSPDNAKYFDDLNKDLNGYNAEFVLAQVKQEYPDAVLVKYENEHGRDEYRIYEKTTSLDAYGYLDDRSSTSDGNVGPNSNLCGGGNVYNLRLDQNLELTDQGIVTTGTYETKTSWSATLTMVQKKEGSVLTVDNLYKVTQKKESEGGRTSGTYAIVQTLDVRNGHGQDTPTSAGNAIYSGKSETQYVISQDWLTTTDTYTADANQYGKVTVEGENGETEQKDAFLQFDYDTVKFEASADSKAEVTQRLVYAELNKTPAPGGEGGGENPGENPEIPGENPENPGEEPEGPTLILTDVPTEEAEIAEAETPLAAGPETDGEEAEIADPETPLTGAPDTEEAEIADEETPLSSVPKTGDESGVFGLMAALSGLALAAMSFVDRKGRHARFGSQH